MATYWEEEEKKRQQAQQQAQQAQQTQQNQQTQQMQTAAQNAPSANLQQQNTYMGNYQPGGTVQQAQQMLQQQIQSKPGTYQSPHMQQVTQLYEQVMNRPKFNYNINADPLYQQYKNQYVQQGQRAMRDTVGTMAGLTGGYGNSYAQGAGQQEYQRYLGMLNAVMPELYGQAYAQYTQEGDELRNNLATAQQMDETAYGRYRDNLGDWQAERDYLTGRYDTEAERDYNQFMDALGYRGDAYNLAIDMMTRGMMPDAQTLAMAGLTQDQAEAFMRSLTAGSGSGRGNGSGNGSGNGNIIDALAAGFAQGATNILSTQQTPGFWDSVKAGTQSMIDNVMESAGKTNAEVSNRYGSIYNAAEQAALTEILEEMDEEKKKR